MLRYIGKGSHGVEKLREDVEAENEGAMIPLEARWLDRLSHIEERVAKGKIQASSVIFFIRGE